MEMRTEPVSGPSVWRGADFAGDTSWRQLLGAAERGELMAGLKAVQASGLCLHQMTAADFPLGPALSALVGRIHAELRDGRGFQMLSGWPIKSLSIDEIRLAYWGFALHLGTCVSQDPRAALVADVMDRGQGRKPLTRGYGSKRHTRLHVDLADCVGLLCVRQAEGGAPTTLAASGAVYNAFLAEHPELVPMLYQGFHWDRFGEEAPGEASTSPTRIPVFSYAGGQLSCRYNYGWMMAAMQRSGHTPSNAETVLFDFFDQTAHALRLEIPLVPGDVYFANNYTVLHGRLAYEEDDDLDPAEKRHLLRVWFNVEGLRRLADAATVRYGLMSHGNLGWTAEELLARRHLQPGTRRRLSAAAG